MPRGLEIKETYFLYNGKVKVNDTNIPKKLERDEGLKFRSKSSVEIETETSHPLEAASKPGWTEQVMSTLGAALEMVGVSLECCKKELSPKSELLHIDDKIKSLRDKIAHHEEGKQLIDFIMVNYDEAMRHVQLGPQGDSKFIKGCILMLNTCIDELEKDDWEAPGNPTSSNDSYTNISTHEPQERSLRLLNASDANTRSAREKWGVIKEHVLLNNKFLIYESKIKLLLSIQEDNDYTKAKLKAFDEKLGDIKEILSIIDILSKKSEYVAMKDPLFFFDKTINDLKTFEHQLRENLAKQQREQIISLSEQVQPLRKEIQDLLQEKFGQDKENLRQGQQIFERIAKYLTNIQVTAEKCINDGDYVDAGKSLAQLREIIRSLEYYKCLLHLGKDPEDADLLIDAYQVRLSIETNPFDNPEVEKIFQETINAQKPGKPYGVPGSSKSS